MLQFRGFCTKKYSHSLHLIIFYLICNFHDRTWEQKHLLKLLWDDLMACIGRSWRMASDYWNYFSACAGRLCKAGDDYWNYFSSPGRFPSHPGHNNRASGPAWELVIDTATLYCTGISIGQQICILWKSVLNRNLVFVLREWNLALVELSVVCWLVFFRSTA